MKHIFLFTLLVLSTAFVQVTAQTVSAEGQKYALIIGIANYPNFPPEHQLKYADRDALQFKQFVQSPEGGSIPEENIRLLTNANATRDKIERGIAWLSQRAHPNDMIYVFFSGHGMVDNNGIVYFMPYGSDYNQPSVGTLRSNYFLKDLSEKITSQHLLVFIDACHAAAATTKDGTEKGGLSRINAELKRSWEQAFKGQEESNMAFFSASANQRSWEDDGKGGVFTWFLIQGLKGAADKNQDKVITAGELHLYLLDNVGVYTKDKFGSEQTPLVTPRFNATFPLSVFIGNWYERGLAAYNRGDYTEAVELLTQAIQNNSQYSESYNVRGLAKFFNGDQRGAILDYSRAIARDPKNDAAYNNRGFALYHLGDKQGAIADYNLAIAINPKYNMYYYGRAKAKFDLGDKQGAIADYNQAIAINPDERFYLGRGFIKSDLGDKQGAIADYNRGIAINPKNGTAYYYRAKVKFDLGDKQGAIADYQQAARLGRTAAQGWLKNNGYSW